MSEQTASMPNESQPPAPRPHYEPPRLLDLGDLPKGHGGPICNSGTGNPAGCIDGTAFGPPPGCMPGISNI